MLNQILWLLLGLIAVIPLLWYAHSKSLRRAHTILGQALIIAALVYVGFALVWGDARWFIIEIAGVLIYFIFYWLSQRHSILWLAAGWLLHPVWDAVLHLLGSGHHIAPEWYVWACISFDFAVAAYIVYRYRQSTPPINTKSLTPQ